MLRQLLNKIRGYPSHVAPSTQDPAMSRGEAARHNRDARLLALRTEVRDIQRAIADASHSRGDGSSGAATEQLDRELAALEVKLERAQRSLSGIQGRI